MKNNIKIFTVQHSDYDFIKNYMIEGKWKSPYHKGLAFSEFYSAGLNAKLNIFGWRYIFRGQESIYD